MERLDINYINGMKQTFYDSRVASKLYDVYQDFNKGSERIVIYLKDEEHDLYFEQKVFCINSSNVLHVDYTKSNILP